MPDIHIKFTTKEWRVLVVLLWVAIGLIFVNVALSLTIKALEWYLPCS